MKITQTLVTQFENDQKAHGTKVAISNIIWMLSAAMLKDIGVTGLQTRYK